MGKIIKKRVEYGGSSNSAENIKYDDTKNVKEAIDEVKSQIADVNSNLPTVVADNGWTLFKFNDGNFIGFFTYTTGNEIPMTESYGAIFISQMLKIQLPQSVLSVTRVVGNSAYLGGGVGGVSVSDIRSSITELTEVPFYFWSATSITKKADAIFICKGAWK